MLVRLVSEEAYLVEFSSERGHDVQALGRYEFTLNFELFDTCDLFTTCDRANYGVACAYEHISDTGCATRARRLGF